MKRAPSSALSLIGRSTIYRAVPCWLLILPSSLSTCPPTHLPWPSRRTAENMHARALGTKAGKRVIFWTDPEEDGSEVHKETGEAEEVLRSGKASQPVVTEAVPLALPDSTEGDGNIEHGHLAQPPRLEEDFSDSSEEEAEAVIASPEITRQDRTIYINTTDPSSHPAQSSHGPAIVPDQAGTIHDQKLASSRPISKVEAEGMSLFPAYARTNVESEQRLSSTRRKPIPPGKASPTFARSTNHVGGSQDPLSQRSAKTALGVNAPTSAAAVYPPLEGSSDDSKHPNQREKPPHPQPTLARQGSNPPGTSQDSSDAARDLAEEVYPKESLDALRAALADPSPISVWSAYYNLALSRPFAGRHLPLPMLHSISRVLARDRPRTRKGFLRLLAIIEDIRRSGAAILTWEWNALIDFAGKGFRKVKQEDFAAAIGIYRDMVKVSRTDTPSLAKDEARPNIITYNILLSIAAHTRSDKLVTQVASLLNSSSTESEPILEPDAITHLSIIPYHTYTGRPDLATEVLRTMITLDIPIDIDAMNAVMWAYARNGAPDVAMGIYAAVRRHAAKMAWQGEESNHTSNPVLSLEGLVFPPHLACDGVTYALLIQALSYRGYLRQSLLVFRDMVTQPAELQPTLQVFRALFIGFARHAGGRRTPHIGTSLGLRLMSKRGAQIISSDMWGNFGGPIGTPELDTDSTRMEWSLDALESLFQSFLDMPLTQAPKPRVIWWILLAYARASGDDWLRLKDVWSRLEVRFAELSGWLVDSRLKRVIERINIEGRGAVEVAGDPRRNDWE